MPWTFHHISHALKVTLVVVFSRANLVVMPPARPGSLSRRRGVASPFADQRCWPQELTIKVWFFIGIPYPETKPARERPWRLMVLKIDAWKMIHFLERGFKRPISDATSVSRDNWLYTYGILVGGFSSSSPKISSFWNFRSFFVNNCLLEDELNRSWTSKCPRLWSFLCDLISFWLGFLCLFLGVSFVHTIVCSWYSRCCSDYLWYSVWVLLCCPTSQREDRRSKVSLVRRTKHFINWKFDAELWYSSELPIRTPLKAFIRIAPGHMIFTSTANQMMRCANCCHRCFGGSRNKPCNHGPLAAAVALSCIYRENAPPKHVELTVSLWAALDLHYAWSVLTQMPHSSHLCPTSNQMAWTPTLLHQVLAKKALPQHHCHGKLQSSTKGSCAVIMVVVEWLQSGIGLGFMFYCLCPKVQQKSLESNCANGWATKWNCFFLEFWHEKHVCGS